MTTSANRFIAPVINPTLLPAPDAIETIAAEDILAARMTDFQERAVEAGFDYDVGSLETDPIKIAETTDAYREVLLRARVNDGIKAILPAYAKGTDLDAIAARANVERLVIVPADTQTGTAAVMESDTSLLVRYLTSFAVPAAGSPDGYIFWSIMTYPAARDVAVLGPGDHGVPGRAAIYLLAEGGTVVDNDTVSAVRDVVNGRSVKPLTDEVVVSTASIVNYSVALTITVPRGPAPSAVSAAARAAVQAVCDARYAIGTKVYANALAGAAYVSNVLRVVQTAPTADIDPGKSGAAFCTAIAITVEVET